MTKRNRNDQTSSETGWEEIFSPGRLVPGRAHTPEQKRAIIERLYDAWLLMPEQRLAQLIKNVYSESDIFYVEDETFVENIEEFVSEHTR